MPSGQRGRGLLQPARQQSWGGQRQALTRVPKTAKATSAKLEEEEQTRTDVN